MGQTTLFHFTTAYGTVIRQLVQLLHNSTDLSSVLPLVNVSIGTCIGLELSRVPRYQDACYLSSHLLLYISTIKPWGKKKTGRTVSAKGKMLACRIKREIMQGQQSRLEDSNLTY